MEKILIIEDNMDMRENTAELLELSHYEVYEASSAEKGFFLAKSCRPDLILCEDMLPGNAFSNFMNAARDDEAIAHIPVVAMCNNNDIHNSGRNCSAAASLNKPFSEEQLYRIISKVLRQGVRTALSP